MRSLFQEFVVAKERVDADHDRDVILAYKTAVWTKTTAKLPKLETLLLAKRRKRRQTVNEMKATLHMLAAQYGGIVRRAAHGR